jgi:hypothetical protein
LRYALRCFRSETMASMLTISIRLTEVAVFDPSGLSQGRPTDGRMHQNLLRAVGRRPIRRRRIYRHRRIFPRPTRK